MDDLPPWEAEREAQKQGRPHAERSFGRPDPQPSPAGPVRQVREITTSDGRTLRLGDKVPLPQTKLEVRGRFEPGQASKAFRSRG